MADIADLLGEAFVEIRARGGQLASDISSELKKSSKTAEKAGDDVGQSFGSSLKNTIGAVSKVAAAAGAAALVAGIAFAIKAGGELEDAQASLKTAINDTGGSYDALAPKIAAAGKAMEAFGYSNAQTDTAIQTMTQATGSGQLAINLLGTAANLAASKHISLADAATMVAKAAGGANKGLKDLNVTVAAGKDWATATGAAQKILADQIQSAGGMANFAAQHHLSLAAATKLVAEASGAASAAQSELAGKGLTLASVTKLITEAQGGDAAAVKELAKHGLDLAAAQKLAGAAAGGSVQAFNALGIDVLPKTATAAQRVAELMQIMNQRIGGQAQTAAQTTAGAVKVLQAQFTDMAANVGAKVLPVITKFLDWAEKSHLLIPAVEVVLGLLAVAMIAVAANFIVATIAAMSFWTAVSLGLIPVIVALIAGIVLLVTHWREVWAEIKSITESVWKFLLGLFRDAAAPFIAAFNAIRDVVVGAFNGIRSAITGGFDPWWRSHGAEIEAVWRAIWGAITAIFRVAWASFMAVYQPAVAVLSFAFHAAMTVITTVVKLGWAAVTTIFNVSMAVITYVFKVGWDVMAAVIKIWWAGVQAVIKTAWDIVVGIFNIALDLITGRWGKAWTDLQNVAVQIWNNIKGFFTTTWDAIKNLGIQIFNALTTALETIFTALWTFVWSDFGAKIYNFFVVTMPQWFATAASAIGTAFNAVKNAVLIPVNWVILNVLDNLIKAFDFISTKVGGPNISQIAAISAAKGARVPGYGGGDIHPALLEGGETVVSKEHSKVLGPAFAAIGVPGYAAGGIIPGGAAASGKTGVAPVVKTSDSGGGGLLGGIWHGVTGVLSKAADAAKIVAALATGNTTALKNALDAAVGTSVGGAVGDLATLLTDIPKTLVGDAVKFLLGKAKAQAAASSGGYHGSYGSGVAQWRPDVLKALAMLGLPASLANAVLYQMQTESGGNPNITNTTDINAQQGHPSTGLMQTIPSTFAAYHVAGTSNNINDPLANIAAAINYARSRYGPSLMSGGMGIGSGHGYALGGLINEPIFGVGASGQTYRFGEGGRREHVVPGVPGGPAGGVTLAHVVARLDKLVSLLQTAPAATGASVGQAITGAVRTGAQRGAYGVR